MSRLREVSRNLLVHLHQENTCKIWLLRAERERIHLVNQLGLELCSFLSELIQKVGASFWRWGDPKNVTSGCQDMENLPYFVREQNSG